MVRKITGWQCDDGKIFATEKAAESYLGREKVKELFEGFISGDDHYVDWAIVWNNRVALSEALKAWGLF